jgi:hypothetical protein
MCTYTQATHWLHTGYTQATQCCLLALSIPLPHHHAGTLAQFLLLSWLYAYYSYDYKWSLKGVHLAERVTTLERKWPFFAGARHACYGCPVLRHACYGCPVSAVSAHDSLTRLPHMTPSHDSLTHDSLTRLPHMTPSHDSLTHDSLT